MSFELNINEELGKKMKRSKALTLSKFGKQLNFFITSNFFPSISVTGTHCSLNCLHCQGRLLERLIHVYSPEQLERKALKLYERGAKGILITGGCDDKGRVPLHQFLPAIKNITSKTDLMLIAHTGFLDVEDAQSLKESGIEGVALDVVGSEETALSVYGLKVKDEDYLRTLRAVDSIGMKIFPHVCVGLDFGEVKGEYHALELIRDVKPTTIIITGLMPLDGTPMEEYRLRVDEYIDIVCEANLNFQGTPITLGCARSVGRDREMIDLLSIESGVLNIAVPTRRAVEYAECQGYKVEWYGACCGISPTERFKIDFNEIPDGEWVYGD